MGNETQPQKFITSQSVKALLLSVTIVLSETGSMIHGTKNMLPASSTTL